MKCLLSFLLLLLLCSQSFAQKEATNWLFGDRAGLNFGGGCPSPLAGSAMRTWKGGAVMSDRDTGELLFYTNGRNIWNREHRLMPGSDDRQPDCSNFAGQPALIVPVPGDAHRFYVFSSYHILYPQGIWFELCDTRFSTVQHAFNIQYSVVDMRLDGGLGDVVASQREVPLETNATEKLTAIPHANGRDYWLLTHGVFTDAFTIHLITPDGVSPPNYQRIGTVHSISRDWPESGIKGMMKASPDGKRLAAAIYNTRFEQPVELFDFDPATGRLSNYTPLGSLQGQYGVSFSPDNTKLYVSVSEYLGKQTADRLWQFDLLAGDAEAVSASGMELILGNPRTNIPPDRLFPGFSGEFMDLQLGPDGRLYALGSYREVDIDPGLSGRTLAVINKPNERGYASDIQYKVFEFGEGEVRMGLPNFMQSYFNGLQPMTCLEETCDDFPLKVFPNPSPGKFQIAMASACAAGAPFSLCIVNAIGQQVVPEQSGLQMPHEVDLTALADGMYLFIFSFPGHRVVKRVVKAS